MLGRVGKLMSVASAGALNQSKLLPIGPFATNTPPLVSSLTNFGPGITFTTDSSMTRAAPLTYATFSLTGSDAIFGDTNAWDFIPIWCDTLILQDDYSLNAYGDDGTNGIADQAGFGGTFGGDGAGGGSGGGGGGAASNTSGDSVGGFGGSGGPGDAGSGPGYPYQQGQAGAGNGASYNSGFTYGNGDAGSSDGSGIIPGGSGGNGFGGGGAGGYAPQGVSIDGNAGGGGAGGGGLIAIVARVLDSTFGLGFVQAFGGQGGAGAGDAPFNGGNGGQGVIWIAAMKKIGEASSININGGNLFLWEIKKNGALVRHTNIDDTWDNT